MTSISIENAETIYITQSGILIIRNDPSHQPIIIARPSQRRYSFRMSHSLWKFFTPAREFPTFPSLNVILAICGEIQRKDIIPMDRTEIPPATKPQK
jgi:hypothetical protein